MAEIPNADQETPVPSIVPGPFPPPPALPFFQRIPAIPFALLSLGIIFFLYQFVGGGITFVLFRGTITEGNVGLVRWSTLIGQVLFILLPTLLLTKLRGHAPVRYLRLNVPEYREIILTVIAVFALQQILQGYMALQDLIPLPPRVQEFLSQFKKLFEETYRLLVASHSPGEFLFVVLVVAFVPAFAEELLFRGLVQRSFEEGTDGLRAAMVAGIIFGAYHMNPFSFIPLIVLGVYFGFIVYRSQNISVAISAHFFNNFVACAAAYVQLDEDFVAIAPGRHPSMFLVSANCAIFLLVFLLATYYFISITSPPATTKG
jgi:uncharacterized protein